MIDQSVQSKVFEVVKELVGKRQTFSAGSIASSLLPMIQLPKSISDIEEYVDTLFQSGEMPRYDRAQQHGLDHTLVFRGALYFPSVTMYEEPTTPLTSPVEDAILKSIPPEARPVPRIVYTVNGVELPQQPVKPPLKALTDAKHAGKASPLP